MLEIPNVLNSRLFEWRQFLFPFSFSELTFHWLGHLDKAEKEKEKERERKEILLNSTHREKRETHTERKKETDRQTCVGSTH